MERRELEKLKDRRTWAGREKEYDKALNSKEHSEELRHFEEYIQKDSNQYSDHAIKAHNFAARIGMLANMPLAEFLMELESKIDRIADEIDNLGRDQ